MPSMQEQGDYCRSAALRIFMCLIMSINGKTLPQTFSQTVVMLINSTPNIYDLRPLQVLT